MYRISTLARRLLGRPVVTHRPGRRPRPLAVEGLEDRFVPYHTYLSEGLSDARWSFNDLAYSYSNLLDGGMNGISPAELTAATQETLGAWAAVSPLTFTEIADVGPPVDGSRYPVGQSAQLRYGHVRIDGPSNTLALTVSPSDDGRGGDSRFDDSETWTVHPSGPHIPGGPIDFLETATHEFGHALGLDHQPADGPGGGPAVMNPFYAGLFSGPGTAHLLPDDVAGIRSLYGAGLGYVLTRGGELNVYGTGDADVLTLSAGGGTVTVTTGDGRVFTRSLAGVTSFALHGQGGDDILRVESDAGLPVTLDGGGGNDFFDLAFGSGTLGAVTGNVLVEGGDGTDTIWAYDRATAGD
jgi:hypothetical protein